MSERVDVSIIVPAYNEARNLPKLLADLRKLRGMTTEIIVVDDGSRDRTAQVAKAAGATVLRLAKNRGKGAALTVGFRAARGRYLVQIDADRQFLSREIPRLVKPLSNGADIVFGSRFVRGAKRQPGAMAWTNFVAHHVICAVAWMVTGIRVHDVMAGFKAFRRECVSGLDLQTPHFGYEAEILVRAGQLGYRVAEAPVTFLRCKEGKSNVSKFRDGCRVLSTIARTAMRHSKSAPRYARRLVRRQKLAHSLSPA